MTKIIIRFIVAAVLVLSSISVCLSNDNGCDDRPNYSASQDSHSQSSQEKAEDHHCICSMSCNNLFVECSALSTKRPSLIISKTQFAFTETNYPQVLLSLDKPPII